MLLIFAAIDGQNVTFRFASEAQAEATYERAVELMVSLR